MSEFSQIEPEQKTRLVFSLPAARFNPDAELFQREVDSSSFSILDIGCGDPPRVSWILKPNQLWVGCDPYIANQKSEKINIITPKRNPVGQYVVYNYDAGNRMIPAFYPDIISVIAPNQKDVINGQVFNDEMEKYLGNKKQLLAVMLDSRTWQSQHNLEAKRFILQWTKEYRFNKIKTLPGGTPPFILNSDNLGSGGNIILLGIRNAK